MGDLNWIKCFWQFDNHVVAPLHGFADVHDYYQQSSAINYLKAIQTNPLLIHALDDPLMTPSVLPDKNQLSETTDLLLTPKGGHVGFLSRTQARKIEFWLQSAVLNYMRKLALLLNNTSILLSANRISNVASVTSKRNYKNN